MVPDVSAMTAASFGRRASNSSATRGRPPVMSRVFALSVGMRAMTSLAFIDQQPCAVLDAMHGPLGPIGIDHGNDHVAHHGDRLAVGVPHYVLVLDLDLSVEVRLDERLLRNLRSTPDVEGPHGQLRAR